MAYDSELAARIRRALGGRPGVTEKAMFGGLSFLLDGKMFCGIVKGDLVVRVGPSRYEESLEFAYVRPMDFTGTPMKGYVYVGPQGCRTHTELRSWIEKGAAFVATLEPSPATRAGAVKRAPATSQGHVRPLAAGGNRRKGKRTPRRRPRRESA